MVLLVCLLALGIGAWSTLSGDQEEPDLAQVSDTEVTLPATQAGEVVENQPWDTLPQVTTSTADSSSETQQVWEADAPVEAVAESPVADYFVMPVTGNILKSFSLTELSYSETYGDYRFHPGIDIEADAGTRVKSAGAGVVKKVYADADLGETVVIDHGNGILAYYCGLNAVPMVSEGDTVLAGTDLGAVDTIPSECADAPHLHLAMQQDGLWVSPLKLMNMEAQSE